MRRVEALQKQFLPDPLPPRGRRKRLVAGEWPCVATLVGPGDLSPGRLKRRVWGRSPARDQLWQDSSKACELGPIGFGQPGPPEIPAGHMGLFQHLYHFK